jgi:hypothetical protein
VISCECSESDDDVSKMVWRRKAVWKSGAGTWCHCNKFWVKCSLTDYFYMHSLDHGHWSMWALKLSCLSSIPRNILAHECFWRWDEHPPDEEIHQERLHLSSKQRLTIIKHDFGLATCLRSLGLTRSGST